jgi:histidinol-phosphatase (PHP family)
MKAQTYSQEVVNLHTHSFYCGHGSGQIREYAQAAVEHGLKVLGFTEHCPVPDSRWARTRMDYEQMPLYEQDVRDARQNTPLTVLTAYECDYLPQYQSYYEELKAKTDYLICSIHDLSFDMDREYSVFWNTLTKEDLALYTDLYCKALQSGLFLFGAHPDVFAYNYHVWDDEAKACSKAIIECAASSGVALEINSNGMRKRKVKTAQGERYAYPILPFWQLASEYPVTVVTNSDAHKPSEIWAGLDKVVSFSQEAGITLAGYTLQNGVVSLGT